MESTSGLAIGDVAAATGLTVETIRIWERRYGRPKGIRLPSGHRRYSDADVRWLRRVAEALANGFRPAKIVPLSDQDLDQVLIKKSPAPPISPEVATLLESVRRFDRDRVLELLDQAHQRHGPIGLLQTVVSGMIESIGRSWADGALSIRHEHFASEVLEDFLRRVRGQVSLPKAAPTIIICTLPAETHGLGLQMVGVAVAAQGVRPLILGTGTPASEIVHAVRETEAKAVAISVSLATGGVSSDRLLADLRRELPAEIALLVGGRGARGVRRGPRGITYTADLNELAAWIKANL